MPSLISPHTLMTISQPHTLGFCAASNCCALARSGVAAKAFIAEPCGVDEARDAVLYVHQLVVHISNKRMQGRETKFQSFKDTLRRWPIS